MSKPVFDVAIIGYGPAGATLANLLGPYGVSVLVLEREAEIYPLPRAIHFDGETMRVSGMPRFTVGQKDIVFLSDTRGVQFSPLVGLMHGRYRVQTDAATSRDYIARDDGAPLETEADVQLPQAANSPANRLKSVARALSPSDFESRISAEVARSVTAR